jgi:hypothetical protein
MRIHPAAARRKPALNLTQGNRRCINIPRRAYLSQFSFSPPLACVSGPLGFASIGLDVGHDIRFQLIQSSRAKLLTSFRFLSAPSNSSTSSSPSSWALHGLGV